MTARDLADRVACWACVAIIVWGVGLCAVRLWVGLTGDPT